MISKNFSFEKEGFVKYSAFQIKVEIDSREFIIEDSNVWVQQVQNGTGESKGAPVDVWKNFY